jgi:hypothetical protein
VKVIISINHSNPVHTEKEERGGKGALQAKAKVQTCQLTQDYISILLSRCIEFFNSLFPLFVVEIILLVGFG